MPSPAEALKLIGNLIKAEVSSASQEIASHREQTHQRGINSRIILYLEQFKILYLNSEKLQNPAISLKLLETSIKLLITQLRKLEGLEQITAVELNEQFLLTEDGVLSREEFTRDESTILTLKRIAQARANQLS